MQTAVVSSIVYVQQQKCNKTQVTRLYLRSTHMLILHSHDSGNSVIYSEVSSNYLRKHNNLDEIYLHLSTAAIMNMNIDENTKSVLIILGTKTHGSTERGKDG